MHYQIWNRTDNIITPSGAKFTAEEWAKKYPFPKMIITTGVINGGCAMEFNQTVDCFKKAGANITDNMTDEEVLAAIEEFEMNPPGADQPSIEERTAAALEAQVLMAMPEETEPAVAKLSTMSVARTAKVAAASNAAPAESAAFQRIQRNYQKGLWSAALVSMAASRGQITSDEASKILNG